MIYNLISINIQYPVTKKKLALELILVPEIFTFWLIDIFQTQHTTARIQAKIKVNGIYIITWMEIYQK